MDTLQPQDDNFYLRLKQMYKMNIQIQLEKFYFLNYISQDYQCSRLSIKYSLPLRRRLSVEAWTGIHLQNLENSAMTFRFPPCLMCCLNPDEHRMLTNYMKD